MPVKNVWKVRIIFRRKAVFQFSRSVSVNLLTGTIDSFVIFYHLTQAL